MAQTTIGGQRRQQQHQRTPKLHRKVRSNTMNEPRPRRAWQSQSAVWAMYFDEKRKGKKAKGALVRNSLELLDVATSGNLIFAMHQCRILHYSRHGFPGYLAFEHETDIGETYMLPASSFKAICTNNAQLQLVLIYVCVPL